MIPRGYLTPLADPMEVLRARVYGTLEKAALEYEAIEALRIPENTPTHDRPLRGKNLTPAEIRAKGPAFARKHARVKLWRARRDAERQAQEAKWKRP